MTQTGHCGGKPNHLTSGKKNQIMWRGGFRRIGGGLDEGALELEWSWWLRWCVMNFFIKGPFTLHLCTHSEKVSEWLGCFWARTGQWHLHTVSMFWGPESFTILIITSAVCMCMGCVQETIVNSGIEWMITWWLLECLGQCLLFFSAHTNL